MKDWSNTTVVFNSQAGDLVASIPGCVYDKHDAVFADVSETENNIRDDPRLRENAEDILYSSEFSGPYHLPEIMHASIARLIERLADPRLPGAEFMETFLLTYRAFTSSEIVINGLIEAYWKVMGGQPSPKKSDSPECKKLAVSRSMSGRSRLRSAVSNASDVSSADDLDASFNSTISPYPSTTVFNYNSVKDQLNSPAKRKLATTKWCQDSAAVLTSDTVLRNQLRQRSASECNVNRSTYNFKPRKISRSQSVEVIIDKSEIKNWNPMQKHEFVSVVNSRSCEHLLDCPSSLREEKKVNIISVASCNQPQNQGGITQNEPECFTTFFTDKDDQSPTSETPAAAPRHRRSLLSEELSALDESRSNDISVTMTKGDLNIDTISQNHEPSQEMSVSFHSDRSSTFTNDYSNSYTQSDLFRNREHSGSFRSREVSGSYTTDEDMFIRTTSQNDINMGSMRSRNSQKMNGEAIVNGDLSLDDKDCITEEVEDEDGNLRNRSSIIASTAGITEKDVGTLEKICESNMMNTSDLNLDNSLTDRSNTMDSSYTTEDGDRRSTMESETAVDRSDTMDNLSIPRSTTMESINSFASSDVSMNERSADVESLTSRSVTHSNSDDMICKQREDLELNPKSASVNEKKTSLSHHFLRKKKEKREDSKKQRSSTISRDEPVLLSIKEKKQDRRVFDRSQSNVGERLPTDKEKVCNGKLSRGEHKSIEVSSIPIPVPAINVNKTPPDATPRRKRSSLFSPFRKSTIKRASSEQDILVSGVKPSPRPAMSQINLNNENERPSFETKNGSLDRKKSTSLRERLSSALSSSEIDLSTKGVPNDGKSSMRRTEKKKKASLRINTVISSAPKEIPGSVNKSMSRRKISVNDQLSRPTVGKLSVSIKRGPLKIMSIFKHWLAKHPKDFIADPQMTNILEDFFVDIKNDSRTLPVVKEIVSSLEKSLNAHRQSLAAVHPFDELLLRKTTIRNHTIGDDVTTEEEFNRYTMIYDYSPYVVAGNMTLLEHYLYARISFNEFVSCQWTKKDKEKRAPGIMKFIKRFNQVTSIISYGVVHGETPDKRAGLIEFWIRTAATCRDLNNFNACVEIISALNASAVHRLKKSWDLVSKPLRDVFADLDTLVSADRSFKNLREAVHMCNPPCVPYLGCYLSDLLFAHEGGQTYNDNGLVNFAKMCRVSRLVREVKCYQQLPYTIDLNDEVAHSLVNWVIDVNLDLLYEQSLRAEPRGS